MNAPASTGSSLVGRMAAIVVHPSRTWTLIAAERATLGDLFKGYVAPLVAIPAVCGLVGALVFGVGILGTTYRPPLGTALLEMLASYVLTLAGVYVLAMIVNLLALTFGGSRNETQALKLVAYSGTAAWLAGLFALYPSVGWLMGLVGGLYSLYTLYLGLPVLMKAPHERVLTYFALVLVAALLLATFVSLVTSRIRDAGGPVLVAEAALRLAQPGPFRPA
ncbi:MAG: Yip1 family protein [Phenylobacterium sp.]